MLKEEFQMHYEIRKQALEQMKQEAKEQNNNPLKQKVLNELIKDAEISLEELKKKIENDPFIF